MTSSFSPFFALTKVQLAGGGAAKVRPTNYSAWTRKTFDPLQKTHLSRVELNRNLWRKRRSGPLRKSSFISFIFFPKTPTILLLLNFSISFVFCVLHPISSLPTFRTSQPNLRNCSFSFLLFHIVPNVQSSFSRLLFRLFLRFLLFSTSSRSLKPISNKKWKFIFCFLIQNPRRLADEWTANTHSVFIFYDATWLVFLIPDATRTDNGTLMTRYNVL